MWNVILPHEMVASVVITYSLPVRQAHKTESNQPHQSLSAAILSGAFAIILSLAMVHWDMFFLRHLPFFRWLPMVTNTTPALMFFLAAF